MTSLAKTYLNITRKNINDLNLNKNHKMDPSNPVWITQQKHFIVLYVHVHTNKFIWTVLHPVLIYAPWLYPICIEHHNICDCLGHPSPNIQKWSSSYLAKNVIFFPIWKGGGFHEFIIVELFCIIVTVPCPIFEIFVIYNTSTDIVRNQYRK